MTAASPDTLAQDTTGSPSAMLDAKLWDNPCPISFRLNYLGLCYNGMLYDWIRDAHGLSRPEYVCLYSLALSPGGTARDISRTSGFPKNTLSRAIKALEKRGLIERRGEADIGARSQALHLSPTGQTLFDETVDVFAGQESRMLAALDPAERQILSGLLSKLVVKAPDWAADLPSPKKDAP
ncbi:winged helix-turn-helix transcriptional regulator [Sulfitobacter albidus]|uniref:Winged helix-turn-helix transcriptional regulator n=1 Tax=Sulfitobacter albidus TaxID=2829501 RepID=A0A975PMW0_9RHOB|nr:MarR family winged helix-turn-helix transcriptional regulator [Sulfitobacter albidus]QUJ77223.1 winged helix-turn-helix transcriptional regulator [Sulfitobacter albidus]